MKIAVSDHGGQVKFQPKLPKSLQIIRLIGNLLIIISVVGLTFSFWPLISAEIPYRINKIRGKNYSVDAPKKQTFGDLLKADLIVPKNLGFGLVVERINANSAVVADVDWTNERVYNRELQKGVAHAKGSVRPGEKGTSFLFSHSVLNPWDVPRYNAVFYLLREVQVGDRIVTFYNGKRYDYYVYDKKVVGGNDVQFLTQKTDEPILILQTCDPPGTTWRRLLVFAKMEGI